MQGPRRGLGGAKKCIETTNALFAHSDVEGEANYRVHANSNYFCKHPGRGDAPLQGPRRGPGEAKNIQRNSKIGKEMHKNLEE